MDTQVLVHPMHTIIHHTIITIARTIIIVLLITTTIIIVLIIIITIQAQVHLPLLYVTRV